MHKGANKKTKKIPLHHDTNWRKHVYIAILLDKDKESITQNQTHTHPNMDMHRNTQTHIPYICMHTYTHRQAHAHTNPLIYTQIQTPKNNKTVINTNRKTIKRRKL